MVACQKQGTSRTAEINATRSQDFGDKEKAPPSSGARTGHPKDLLASERWDTGEIVTVADASDNTAAPQLTRQKSSGCRRSLRVDTLN
jgi:hypothetical protein